MREKFRRHWCFRCYAPFGGYRRCRGINRARSKRAWRSQEEV